MITLTRAELNRLTVLAARSAESSVKAMAAAQSDAAAELHKLEWENMTSLAEKLEKVIQSDCKRTATGW